MIEKHDASIEDLVYQLGDREDVIREYYAGFKMSKGIAEKLSRKLG